MIETGKHTPLLNFLVEPRLRIWRHVLLVSILLIISFNQIFIAYQDINYALGNKIYWIFLAVISYLAAIYFNLYVLVPKLLLKKKYALYFISLSLLVFSLLILILVQEYALRTVMGVPHRIASYTNPIILVDSLSSSTIMMVCFLGTSGTILLKKWIMERQHIKDLEQEHIRSEVNKLKEQITPSFLSKILNHTSILVKTDPMKASDMLMRLGQLLRYQLYDCSREKVLLSSEINFLTGYLTLEKLYTTQFDYEITIEGNVNNIFVTPLLFMPFVQQMMRKTSSLHLNFESVDGQLLFSCNTKDYVKLLKEDFSTIKKRLDLLYPTHYDLSVAKEKIELRLNLSES